MKSLLDKYGNLNIEDIVVNQPSFKRIIEDGIITEEEIEEQSQRVVAKIKEIEAIATPEVKEKMRELLAEMSVLVAISNLNDVTTTDEQVYHCSECGTEFHKHDVFCPNPKCGKLITYMDYQN